MEAKLNKVDLEIRHGINEKTSNKKVHRKEENIIRENDNSNKNFKDNNHLTEQKSMLIDAKIDIGECRHEEAKGLLLDRKL